MIKQKKIRKAVFPVAGLGSRFLPATKAMPKELIPKLWNGKFVGQSQKWFLFKFIGADFDINIETKDQEFSDWKWSKKTEMLDSIVPFKRSLYQSVLKDFHLEL